MAQKLWNGRFSSKTDHAVETFTASIDTDKRLYAYDIDGSIAHCKMLAATGILTEDEASQLVQGLGRIKREIEDQKFYFDDSLEDIHMHIEARLLQQVGKVAQKLHTARSRNDQVALDMRMYLKDETSNIIGGLLRLQNALVTLCMAHKDTVMPGYTHLQRAQPVLLAHHFMAYYEMFSRDVQRLRDALKRIDVLPLGSAALAGTTYPIDRNLTAELLNFQNVSANSIDSVSDRDFIIEFLSVASLCMMHLSRLSEELVIWSSFEFGFIELPDAFATGSSIMPQKKNPDVPELIRGKTGRVFGDLVSLLTLMKALPLAYNRDMQEDKRALFDTVDTLKACVEIYIKMLPRLKINTERMRQATHQGYLNATDLADYLTAKGMPFRESHACAGRVVGHAVAQQKEIQDLSVDELRSFSNLISEDVFDFLTPERMVGRRLSAGGTAPENVMAAIQKAREHLKKEGVLDE